MYKNGLCRKGAVFNLQRDVVRPVGQVGQIIRLLMYAGRLPGSLEYTDKRSVDTNKMDGYTGRCSQRVLNGDGMVDGVRRNAQVRYLPVRMFGNRHNGTAIEVRKPASVVVAQTRSADIGLYYIHNTRSLASTDGIVVEPENMAEFVLYNIR